MTVVQSVGRNGKPNDPNGGRVVLFDACGHVSVYRSATLTLLVGDVLLCVRCNMSRMVAAVDDELRVRCQTCTYSRGWELAALSASTDAIRHSKGTGHVTFVMHGNKRKERYDLAVSPGQRALEELTDIPPF
jgi:hypothetical protein